MLSSSRTLAALVIAGLCAIAAVAIAVPAVSAPSPRVSGHVTALSLAQKAFNLAKVADKRSKTALAKAKPGTNGAPGAPGANGSNGTNGKDSTVPGPAGSPGSTLKPQLTTADFASATTLTPPPHPVAFTQAADRGNMVAAGVTVTPPASATCSGGGQGIQVDVYLDTVDSAHQLLTAQFPAAVSPVATTLTSKPGYLVRGGSSSGHNLIVTAADNCTGGGHGSVSNVKVDVVEFAPAP